MHAVVELNLFAGVRADAAAGLDEVVAVAEGGGQGQVGRQTRQGMKRSEIDCILSDFL